MLLNYFLLTALAICGIKTEPQDESHTDNYEESVRSY
jgi:hypothetical protein